MPILNTVMSFLTSDLTLPVWLPLLLFLTSLPIFIKLLRWFKKPKATAPKTTPAQSKRASATPKTSVSSSTNDKAPDNVFTSSLIIAAQKLKSITDDPNNKFTSSVISAVHKLKSIKDPAVHALTDSIATTAGKLKSAIESPAATAKASKTQRVSGKTQSEDEKDNVIKLLLASKGDGKLNQSLADDMQVSSAIVTTYLNDLMQTKLVESRRNLIGETFYLTSLGNSYCVEKGYTTNAA